jgi:hypothetical protein
MIQSTVIISPYRWYGGILSPAKIHNSRTRFGTTLAQSSNVLSTMRRCMRSALRRTADGHLAVSNVYLTAKSPNAIMIPTKKRSVASRNTTMPIPWFAYLATCISGMNVPILSSMPMMTAQVLMCVILGRLLGLRLAVVIDCLYGVRRQVSR